MKTQEIPINKNITTKCYFPSISFVWKGLPSDVLECSLINIIRKVLTYTTKNESVAVMLNAFFFFFFFFACPRHVKGGKWSWATKTHKT